MEGCVKRLSNQGRSSQSRQYQMRKRAEAVIETRQRIVDAATELHGTVGPAGTTIAGIAERAGVTRPTVYRHFSDDEALFAACSANWFSLQPSVPDPGAWLLIPHPAERMRVGLTDLYRFFRNGHRTLTLIYRDFESSIPEAHQAVMRARNAQQRDALVAAFPRPTKRLVALVGHATSFSTWRSLCFENTLSDRAAVEAMTALVLEATPN